MSNLLSFSGGVDSTALALHLIEQRVEFTPVFCDTGWEHPETLKYIEYCSKEIFDGKLVTLTSEKYPNGMVDLVKKKKRVPSAKARFCTGNLKVDPMAEYTSSREVETVYVGIRADESPERSKMVEREWSDKYDCYVERPLLVWTKAECFKILEKHQIKPNPLYKKGCGRVGCFPCVMINHGELKRVSEFYPEIWENIDRLEKLNNRSFFPPNYIPSRFHTGVVKRYEFMRLNPEVKGKSFPWAKDVKKYLGCTDDSQLSFMPTQSCMSIYNLCE